ncbi:hypothetical protein ACFOD4_13305 [Pseudoroseomonas globiformis]|uniref:Glycoside hydrolase family 65 central catalytic domain-containing protein n=1 Tax=Teichococcus globiformis TaxID=2307229 RepID=A0ABV7G4C3_9PROT
MCRALSLRQAEVAHWQHVARGLRLAFANEGTLLPFEGFDRLRPLDLQAMAEKHAGQRLDWVLECQGEGTNGYQVLKQADTMMLPFLLPRRELSEALAAMGHAMTEEQGRRTAEHDLTRTTHDSSMKPEHDPSGASSVAEEPHLGTYGDPLTCCSTTTLGCWWSRAG